MLIIGSKSGKGRPITGTCAHGGASFVHSCHADKESAPKRVKAQVRAIILAIAAYSGHGDGETYADCMACGQPAYVSAPNNSPDKLTMGHRQSENNGGRYCVLNLIPECLACNMAHGTVDATAAYRPRYTMDMRGWGGSLNVFVPDVPEPRGMGTGAGRGPESWHRSTATRSATRRRVAA